MFCRPCTQWISWHHPDSNLAQPVLWSHPGTEDSKKTPLWLFYDSFSNLTNQHSPLPKPLPAKLSLKTLIPECLGRLIWVIINLSSPAQPALHELPFLHCNFPILINWFFVGSRQGESTGWLQDAHLTESNSLETGQVWAISVGVGCIGYNRASRGHQ